jgi:serine/threonine-protein kinase
MERLLAELHPAPRTGRYALGAAVALAATAAWLGRSEDETSCTDRAELTGTWDDNRRKALEAALAVERSDHARSVGTAIERRLDVYANRWSAAYRVACDSKGEQLGASRAEAFGCLARARTQLATFVEGTLQGVESDRREEVARSALLLPEPATCLESTGSDVAPGPEHEKLAELLAEGRGYWLSGQSSMAEATARAVLATAESRGQKAIVADAALLAGQTALRDHRGEQAVPYLEQAYETALEARQDLIALRAAGALVHHYTNRAGNEELAERWLAAGKTLLRRDESLPADVLLAEAAFLRVRQGRYPEAISLYEEALTARRARNIDHDSSLATLLSEGAEAYRGNGDPDHALEYLRQARSIWAQIGGSKGLEVSRLDRRLAGVYKSKGEFERAIELYRRAASGTEASVGPEHNEIANIYNGLGGALAQTGRWDEAREAFERALPIYEKYDARQQAAIVLTNLGNVAGSQGHHDEAERYFIRSLEARRADVGTDHPDVALTLNNLGFLMMTTGRLDRAQAYHEEALAIRSKVLGSEHPDTANSLANLALVFEAQGRFDEALALQQRALEIRRARLGPSHRDTIGAILSMARNRGKAGDLETAARHVETALERCSPSCAAFEALAEVALTVAEKLYRAGKTPRASSLLRRIRQEIPEAPMPSWLRRQG